MEVVSTGYWSLDTGYWVGGGGARITFAGKRMGPGGFRGLQIRWAGLSRVGRRVRFPCASATGTWLADAYAVDFFCSEGRG